VPSLAVAKEAVGDGSGKHAAARRRWAHLRREHRRVDLHRARRCERASDRCYRKHCESGRS